MSDTTTEPDDELETDGTDDRDGDDRPTSRVTLGILWAVFAILYGYPLFEGISNLIALPQFYAESKLTGVPWLLLIIGVLAPVVLYAAALLLGRGRDLFARALILAVGLGATNAAFLSVVQWAKVG